MLINPNLYNGDSKIIRSPLNTGSATDNFNLADINLNVLNLEEGKTYTCSLRIKQSSNGSGKFSAQALRGRNWLSRGCEKKVCKVGEIAFYTFTYEKGNTDNMVFYTDISGETRGIGAIFYEIKLEEGNTATPYLPHKDTLEPSKQALLTTGGGYLQRFIHCREKRGAIC